jgi:hypothetical protein
MFGPKNDGITARAVKDMFDRIDTLTGRPKPKVQMSYMEVYNNNIFDLLSKQREPRGMRYDSRTGATVTGLTWSNVESPDDVETYMKHA